MEVKEYTPLWNRESNQCETCTPKLVDVNHSNYYIEEDMNLYIIYEGEQLKLVKSGTQLANNQSSYDLNGGLLVTTDEQGDVVEIEVVSGCIYQYGYISDEDVDTGIEGSIMLVNIDVDNCNKKDFVLINYVIDCEELLWTYICNGAINRIPSNIADEATGILPNGQSKRYFARIEKKVEFRVKNMSETDLDILEYIINQPTSLFINQPALAYNISEGSIFTFESESYGLFFGVVEMVQSTLIIEQCCTIGGS